MLGGEFGFVLIGVLVLGLSWGEVGVFVVEVCSRLFLVLLPSFWFGGRMLVYRAFFEVRGFCL